MKKHLPLAVLALTPLLSQCVVETGGPTAPSNTPAPNVSGSAQQSQAVFDLAFQKGLQDGRGGLSRTPGRHAGSYPAAESDAFDSGYEKGYNQGIR